MPDAVKLLGTQSSLSTEPLGIKHAACFLLPQLEGQGLLPFTQDKQNLFLTTAISIANQQSLPLISLNVSSWKAAPANRTGNRQALHPQCKKVLLCYLRALPFIA